MRLRTPSPPPDLAQPPSVAPAVDLDAARRRTRRRSLLRRAGMTSAAVGVLAGATWLVGYSDVLALEQVLVVGVDDPLRTTVLEAAAAPLGVPLARVDLVGLTRNVEQVPEVDTVTAGRSWPSTVRLEVVPREPLAVIESAGAWQYLDDEGVLFGAAPGPDDSLPVVVAPDTETGVQARAAAVGVAGVLPESLRTQVERVEATSPVEVRLLLRDGRTVVWGSVDESERKAEVLAVLLRTPATAYDVSVPDRPTLRPAS